MIKPERLVTWTEVEDMTAQLARQIATRGLIYDVIIGIARGGMIPVSLLAQILPHGMILTCHLRRYEPGQTQSTAFPTILAFPPAELLYRKRVLIVDEVWDRGDSIIGAKQVAEKCEPTILHTAVLHFKPESNRYECSRPNYFVEETADWVEYPWETFIKKYVPAV